MNCATFGRMRSTSGVPASIAGPRTPENCTIGVITEMNCATFGRMRSASGVPASIAGPRMRPN